MPEDFADLPQPEYEGTVAVDALATDGDNPNEMTDEQFGLLCDRMRENGWLGGPIVTDTEGLIADGEHRWRAAQEIGLSEVPVRQFDIDDATRRLWRQELNKIHGEHDSKRDALEYDALLSEGFTEEVEALTDAADEDLDELLAEIRVDNSVGPAYEYDPEHNVYFEDCVDGMRERVEDNSVACLLTDPPFGVNYGVGAGDFSTSAERSTLENNETLGEARELLDDVLSVFSEKATDDCHAYIFANHKSETMVRELLDRHGWTLRSQLVWVKDSPMGLAALGNNVRSAYAPKHETAIFATRESENTRPVSNFTDTVFEIPRVNNAEHPTEKPVPLLGPLVRNSTLEGELVCDPFMGSGATAIAAIQNDRDYVGFELDEDNYRDVIERRIGEAKRQREAGVNAAESET
jgi:DNA modification methylase